MTRFVLLTAVAAICLAGCGTKPPPAPISNEQRSEVATDPWPAAATSLRRQPDLAGARQMTNQITADLANNPTADGIPVMPDTAVKTLADQLHLSPQEIKEISSANYTNLDAAYVAECLIFRDAARSLDLASLPPERQALAAFRWTCRHVYLRQAIQQRAADSIVALPPVPPQYVLSRGYGTGLERAYVFLAILQQLGLDACLIGPPNREQATSISVKNDKVTNGPFWAVGARTSDGTILLFDPWRGEPFPAAGGGGVANLAQIQSTPDLLKAWFEDKARPWDVTPADIKDATVYLSTSFLACTPRMQTLEKKLAGEVNVKLTANLADLLARFGPKAKIWAPHTNQDPYSYPHVLGYFLPTEEGGFDSSPAGPEQLYLSTTKLSPMPWDQIQLPKEWTANDLQTRMRLMFLGRLHEWIFEVNPREKLARGQLNEVVRLMVEREQRFNAMKQQDRANNLSSASIQEWMQRANQVSQELSLAKLPQNQARLPDAEANYNRFWKTDAAQFLHLEIAVMLPIASSEVSYLLAHSKHEQAERAQLRLHRLAANAPGRADALTAAKDAWAVAKDAWDRHLVGAGATLELNKEKTAHLRQLAARAEKLVTKAGDEW